MFQWLDPYWDGEFQILQKVSYNGRMLGTIADSSSVLWINQRPECIGKYERSWCLGVIRSRTMRTRVIQRTRGKLRESADPTVKGVVSTVMMKRHSEIRQLITGAFFYPELTISKGRSRCTVPRRGWERIWSQESMKHLPVASLQYLIRPKDFSSMAESQRGIVSQCSDIPRCESDQGLRANERRAKAASWRRKIEGNNDEKREGKRTEREKKRVQGKGWARGNDRPGELQLIRIGKLAILLMRQSGKRHCRNARSKWPGPNHSVRSRNRDANHILPSYFAFPVPSIATRRQK
jgi:hypothetical protein